MRSRRHRAIQKQEFNTLVKSTSNVVSEMSLRGLSIIPLENDIEGRAEFQSVIEARIMNMLPVEYINVTITVE